MAFGYPISLEVAGRRAVVIGAGAVAQGKVEALVRAGASVRVIAEGPEAVLTRLEDVESVTIERRRFRRGDLEGAFVCVAASTSARTRAAIHREAQARGVLVNVMDDVPHCDFAAPAIVRRGDLSISVSTGGRSPALARRLRIELEERFGWEWAEVLNVLATVRDETLHLLPDLADRARRWEEALDLEETRALVADGRPEEARVLLRRRLVPEGAA